MTAPKLTLEFANNASPAQASLSPAPCSASGVDATDFGWNNPDEECEPDFTLDDLEWSEMYE